MVERKSEWFIEVEAIAALKDKQTLKEEEKQRWKLQQQTFQDKSEVIIVSKRDLRYFGSSWYSEQR